MKSWNYEYIYIYYREINVSLYRFELIFDRFSSNKIQNVFQIGSEWFALARIQISEWIGKVLIGSEWICIQNVCQSNYAWESSDTFSTPNALSFTVRKICTIFSIHVMEAWMHNMKLNLVFRRILNLIYACTKFIIRVYEI